MRAHWFLAGFSGCGKSAVGPHVARLAARTFVDLDGVVALRAKRPVPDLLDEVGEAAFRALEAEALAALLRVPSPDGEPLIVALGGGSLESEGVRTLAEQAALVVWLDAPLATCLARLEGAATRRPLLGAARAAGGDGAVTGLYEHRSERYRGADVRVDASGPLGMVAVRVVESLRREENRRLSSGGER